MRLKRGAGSAWLVKLSVSRSAGWREAKARAEPGLCAGLGLVPVAGLTDLKSLTSHADGQPALFNRTFGHLTLGHDRNHFCRSSAKRSVRQVQARWPNARLKRAGCHPRGLSSFSQPLLVPRRGQGPRRAGLCAGLGLVPVAGLTDLKSLTSHADGQPALFNRTFGHLTPRRWPRPRSKFASFRPRSGEVAEQV